MLNIAIFIIMIFSSCSQQSWQKHIESAYEISYPESWSKQQKGMATFFLSPKDDEKDQFQENVNVMVQDLSNQPMTLEEYTELTKQQITQALGSSVIVSIKELDFAGQKAKEMIYGMPKNPLAGINQDLKLRQVWFIKDNKAYLLTYTAKSSEYENYLETTKEIFNSFKLKI